MSRLTLFTAVVTLLWVGWPTATGAQEVECTWCYQCPEPNEDYMRTEDNWPGFDYILWINMRCREGEQGECSLDVIPCDPAQNTAQEQAQLAVLVDNQEVEELVRFLAQIADHVEKVPSRNLLLYRGGCRHDVLGVYQIDAELFARLEQEASGLAALLATA